MLEGNMNTLTKASTLWGVCAAYLFFSFSVHASIVIDGSRVIYNQKEKDVTVRITNEGGLPSVVQSWVDAGDISTNPSLIKVPFLLTPPMARVDPAKSQVLRLIYTGEKLPEDRESVFYLNVLDIRPKPDNAESLSTIQLAIRTRIKLFFRPQHLAGDVAKAPAKLKWSVVKSDGGWKLKGENSSAFHISMVNIVLASGQASSSVGEGMVAPFEKIEFALTAAPAINTQVKFSSIDDFGAAREFAAVLNGQ